METITLEKTYDYDAFTRIPGNRPVSEIKVRRLMRSFKERYLGAEIIINSKNQIIDGQHRLEAAKRLGLPVWKHRVNGEGINEVQRRNNNNDVWRNRDFLHSYCELNVEPYVRLREFMKHYPEFGLATAMVILSDNLRPDRDTKEYEINGERGGKSKPFREGQFTIPDLGLAYENAGKIMQYKKFYKGFKRMVFVQTLISLFKNKKFDNDTMLKKLELQPTSLVNCPSMEQYKLLLEGIYNFKSRSKVSFRY
jgi:hypothetical protein